MPVVAALCRPTQTVPNNNGAEKFELYVVYDRDQTNEPVNFAWEIRYVMGDPNSPPLASGPTKLMFSGTYELIGVPSSTNSKTRLEVKFPLKAGDKLRSVCASEMCYYTVLTELKRPVSSLAPRPTAQAGVRMFA